MCRFSVKEQLGCGTFLPSERVRSMILWPFLKLTHFPNAEILGPIDMYFKMYIVRLIIHYKKGKTFQELSYSQ